LQRLRMLIGPRAEDRERLSGGEDVPAILVDS
jgi:hypothetical protein